MPPSSSNEHASTAEKIQVLNKTAVDINVNDSRAYLICCNRQVEMSSF
jgi:hypothetical protein